MNGYEIIDASPFDDGSNAGRQLGNGPLQRQTRAWLDEDLLSHDLGAMTQAALVKRVIERFGTPPDDACRPELDEIYPDRVDYVRGLAEGAGCTVAQAALYDYIQYVREIRRWSAMMHPPICGENCSGVLFTGPQGVIAGQNIDSGPEQHPPAFEEQQSGPVSLVLKRPRSGYIEDWGLTNEHGVGTTGGGSCGTWLDEPIVDVWPIKHVPLLRFARNVRDVEDLSLRYRLFNWGRSSAVWVDLSGDAIVTEHTFRRVGVRQIEQGAVWSTEGHFETEEMASFLRERRRTYVRTAGKHLGADDLQYAADCAVRFAHIGELVHRDLGRGEDHMRQVMTDHAPFPRRVCRHGGPDTDSYDHTITLQSSVSNLTTNRTYIRVIVPGKKFCCEVAERVTEYPPRPCDAGRRPK